MFYLGVMREQLVAIEAGSQLNLDELTLDDLMEEPEEQSVFGSLGVAFKDTVEFYNYD
jgi:hypothetical protein